MGKDTGIVSMGRGVMRESGSRTPLTERDDIKSGERGSTLGFKVCGWKASRMGKACVEREEEAHSTKASGLWGSLKNSRTTLVRGSTRHIESQIPYLYPQV